MDRGQHRVPARLHRPRRDRRQFIPPASSSRSSTLSFAARLGVVAANLRDEAFGVLAAVERLDGVAEWEVGRESVVDARVHQHTGNATSTRTRRRTTAPCSRSSPRRSAIASWRRSRCPRSRSGSRRRADRRLERRRGPVSVWSRRRTEAANPLHHTNVGLVRVVLHEAVSLLARVCRPERRVSRPHSCR